jgi:hypothetical protein
MPLLSLLPTLPSLGDSSADWRRRLIRNSSRLLSSARRARGDAGEESDLDLLVALKADDPDRKIKAAALDIACALTLESGVLVSIFVADKEFLKQHEGFSFFQAVAEEGVEGIATVAFVSVTGNERMKTVSTALSCSLPLTDRRPCTAQPPYVQYSER